MAHFDVGALLASVQEQDVGIVVSTNNVEGFKRIVYDHMRAQPSLKCSILAAPDSASKFWLVKTSTLPQELLDGQASS